MQKNHWRNSAPIQLTDNALMEKNMTNISFNPYLHHTQKLTRTDMCMGACSVTANSLRPHGLQPARLIYPWYFPGKNIGMGCHFLFQRIFLTQGLKRSPLCLLHWQANSLPLSHLGSPEWITDLNVIAKTLQYLEDSLLHQNFKNVLPLLK